MVTGGSLVAMLVVSTVGFARGGTVLRGVVREGLPQPTVLSPDSVPLIARVFTAGRCHFLLGQPVADASCVTAINDTVLQLVPGQFPAPSVVTVRVGADRRVRVIVVDYGSGIGIGTIVGQFTTAFRARPQIVNTTGPAGSTFAARWTDGRTRVTATSLRDGADAHVEVQFIDVGARVRTAPTGHDSTERHP